MDTRPESYRVLLQRLRELSPERKLEMMIDRTDAGREIHRLAMARVAEPVAKYPK
jgi:hypothetical protein